MGIKEIGNIVFWLGVILCAVAGLAFAGFIAQSAAGSLLVAGVVAILVGVFLRSGQIGGK